MADFYHGSDLLGGSVLQSAYNRLPPGHPIQSGGIFTRLVICAHRHRYEFSRHIKDLNQGISAIRFKYDGGGTAKRIFFIANQFIPEGRWRLPTVTGCCFHQRQVLIILIEHGTYHGRIHTKPVTQYRCIYRSEIILHGRPDPSSSEEGRSGGLPSTPCFTGSPNKKTGWAAP